MRVGQRLYQEEVMGKLESDWIMFIELVYLILEDRLLDDYIGRVNARIFELKDEMTCSEKLAGNSDFSVDYYYVV